MDLICNNLLSLLPHPYKIGQDSPSATDDTLHFYLHPVPTTVSRNDPLTATTQPDHHFTYITLYRPKTYI